MRFLQEVVEEMNSKHDYASRIHFLYTLIGNVGFTKEEVEFLEGKLK